MPASATNNGAEPRVGIAYNIKGTGTVLRVAYCAHVRDAVQRKPAALERHRSRAGWRRTYSAAHPTPIQPGRRNQFNTGFQQAIGKYLMVDADYFWKYTHNAYDFSTLLNTTITFPISWHNSKLDGVTGRVSTTNLHGFQAYWTFGHTRARYFLPEDGGLIPQGTPLAGGVFRIDHDQAFQSTGNLPLPAQERRVDRLTWRFDSGLVVSGVPDAAAALALTPNQQLTIGFACNGVSATFSSPITTCNGTGTSKLLTLPQTGTGERRSQSRPREAAQYLQPGHRHRQPVPHGKAREDHGVVRHRQHHQQSGAVQLPVDVQRHAFPAAAHADRARRPDLLRPELALSTSERRWAGTEPSAEIVIEQ